MRRIPTLPRRLFLGHCAFSTAALATPISLLGSTNSPNPSMDAPIVGTGSHRYRVWHDWGQLPSGYAYGNTHGVAVANDGRVLIKNTVGAGSQSGDAILVFDPRGRFLSSWGPEYRGGAHGLHRYQVGNEERLLLCDTQRRIVAITSLDGRELGRLTVPESAGLYSDPKTFVPTNVATAPDGRIFVADGYGLSYIHRYGAGGNYLGSFGGKGSEAGRLNCPHGLMVDTRGNEPLLLVADRGNRRLQYFDLEGKPRSIVTDELRAPCHFDQRGGVLLIPDLEARVTLFDAQNRLLTHLGDGGHYQGLRDQPREKFAPGRFIAPHSACFDAAGNIFVVEWVEVGRVTKLERLS